GPEVHRPPGRGRAPALDLQLRDDDERPGRPGRPPAPLRRLDQDQTTGAPPLLDDAGPRREPPAPPAGGRGPPRDRGRGLPPEPRLALQGLPLPRRVAASPRRRRARATR